MLWWGRLLPNQSVQSVVESWREPRRLFLPLHSTRSNANNPTSVSESFYTSSFCRIPKNQKRIGQQMYRCISFRRRLRALIRAKPQWHAAAQKKQQDNIAHAYISCQNAPNISLVIVIIMWPPSIHPSIQLKNRGVQCQKNFEEECVSMISVLCKRTLNNRQIFAWLSILIRIEWQITRVIFCKHGQQVNRMTWCGVMSRLDYIYLPLYKLSRT